jgi:hypothetical protein
VSPRASRGEGSTATALYLDPNLEKTFVVVRIMARGSYPTDAFTGLNSLHFFDRVVDFGS